MALILLVIMLVITAVVIYWNSRLEREESDGEEKPLKPRSKLVIGVTIAVQLTVIIALFIFLFNM